MPAIYHMTHMRNLPGIIAQGGLWCDRAAAAQGHCQQSIAHAHIKERRARRMVTAGQGGTLADYVPFYFATRQPMLYAIHRGGVASYHGGQADVVYLRLSTDGVQRSGVAFAFSSGHAQMELAEFSHDLSALAGLVDLPLMTQRYWTDTPADPNREFRRQAEFLIHDFAPWGLIEEIGVYSDSQRTRLQTACERLSPPPPIAVRPAWYF